ncbi:hypothetical protein LEMLEM_LOCUS13304, partial [Lemmus lemmus]
GSFHLRRDEPSNHRRSLVLHSPTLRPQESHHLPLCRWHLPEEPMWKGKDTSGEVQWCLKLTPMALRPPLHLTDVTITDPPLSGLEELYNCKNKPFPIKLCWAGWSS